MEAALDVAISVIASQEPFEASLRREGVSDAAGGTRFADAAGPLAAADGGNVVHTSEDTQTVPALAVMYSSRPLMLQICR
jgi:hypothetical protein